MVTIQCYMMRCKEMRYDVMPVNAVWCELVGRGVDVMPFNVV